MPLKPMRTLPHSAAARPEPLPRQRGIALFDALMSILVLSFGLLGLASVLPQALRTSGGSSQRVQATILAYDMLDRIRANVTGAQKGQYDISLCKGLPNPTTVAASDVVEWCNTLAAMLKSGTGSVAYDPAGVTVTVRWDDSRGGVNGTGSATQEFQVTSRP